jgi:hypothetical protein
VVTAFRERQKKKKLLIKFLTYFCTIIIAAMERRSRYNHSSEASTSGETEESLKGLTHEELKMRCEAAGIRPLPRTKNDMIDALLLQEESAGASAGYVASSATTRAVRTGTNSRAKRPRESDAESKYIQYSANIEGMFPSRL